MKLGKLFGKNTEEINYTENYLGLRNIWLDTKRERGDSSIPYALLMEFHMPRGVITLAASQLGDASLLFNQGGGILGSGTVDFAAAQSKKLVNLSKEYITYGEKVSEFPHPQKDEIIFYIVTKEGVYKAQDKAADITSDKSNLSGLHAESNNLITAIRLVQEQSKKVKN